MLPTKISLLCLLVSLSLACARSELRSKPSPVPTSQPRDSVLKLSIAEIQGAGHWSPVEGRRVEIEGVVTAVGDEGFWLQDPVGDGDEATSDALCVSLDAASVSSYERPAVGQSWHLVGTVEESLERAGDLPVTCLRFERGQVLGTAAALPAPIQLGDGGRQIPSEVADDDDLERFEPASDGIDFFESLEGMRVRVSDARVVGATDRRGSLVVVADGGRRATTLHRRGGLLRREGDANPEALLVDGGLGIVAPTVDLGHRLTALEAIVDHGWGSYRLRLTSAPEVGGSPVAAERTELLRDERHLTVASFNVLNLAVTDEQSKFARLADLVVGSLGSPDLLALQEIQDDTGAEDDGVVSAGATYRRLIDAIEDAGGPRYEVRQIDPTDGADGGRPGGNIRVAFLFDPSRLEALDTSADGSADGSAPTLRRDGSRLRLTPSPARLEDAAFEADRERGWGGARKPLVAQFRFRGRDLFVMAQHLRSKGADDPVFGRVQPPRRHSEGQRNAQAAAVRRWVDELLDLDPEAWVVVLGDMNEHLERPPLRILAGARMHDLVADLPPDERYTYVFLGNAQVLDHILVSRAVAEAEPEIDIVHTCADYNSERQASDHDPLVMRVHVP